MSLQITSSIPFKIIVERVSYEKHEYNSSIFSLVITYVFLIDISVSWFPTDFAITSVGLVYENG